MDNAWFIGPPEDAAIRNDPARLAEYVRNQIKAATPTSFIDRMAQEYAAQKPTLERLNKLLAQEGHDVDMGKVYVDYSLAAGRLFVTDDFVVPNAPIKSGIFTEANGLFPTDSSAGHTLYHDFYTFGLPNGRPPQLNKDGKPVPLFQDSSRDMVLVTLNAVDVKVFDLISEHGKEGEVDTKIWESLHRAFARANHDWIHSSFVNFVQRLPSEPLRGEIGAFFTALNDVTQPEWREGNEGFRLKDYPPAEQQANQLLLKLNAALMNTDEGKVEKKELISDAIDYMENIKLLQGRVSSSKGADEANNLTEFLAASYLNRIHRAVGMDDPEIYHAQINGRSLYQAIDALQLPSRTMDVDKLYDFLDVTHSIPQKLISKPGERLSREDKEFIISKVLMASFVNWDSGVGNMIGEIADRIIDPDTNKLKILSGAEVVEMERRINHHGILHWGPDKETIADSQVRLVDPLVQFVKLLDDHVIKAEIQGNPEFASRRAAFDQALAKLEGANAEASTSWQERVGRNGKEWDVKKGNPDVPSSWRDSVAESNVKSKTNPITK
jgi:hypothetical protein